MKSTTTGNRNRWTGARLLLIFLSLLATAVEATAQSKSKDGAGAIPKVSYDKQIRPIFQARCQGCHQPAKAGGGYVMTTFDRLLKGGDSDDLAIIPGKPAESHLIEQITPQASKAEMPQTNLHCPPVRSN
jgi:mono/diheme cytochrome c family protein